MAFASGTLEAGKDPVAVCAAGENGVTVRNNGGTVVFLGGPDVTTGGYPLDPGESVTLNGAQHRPAGVVPAPASDGTADVVYALTDGSGVSRVSWIGA